MHKLKRILQVSVLAVAVYCAAGAECATAQNALFSEPAAPLADAGPQPAHVSRARFVNFDTSTFFTAAGELKRAIDLPELGFNLFPGTNVVGQVTKIERNAGSTAWIGNVKGDPLGRFYIVTVDGAFIAHVVTESRTYEVSRAPNGRYLVVQIDQSRLQEHPPGRIQRPGPILKPQYDGGFEDSGEVIDVLVLYTRAARVAEGSPAAMKARIALAMLESNQAYQAAGVTPRLRLVRAHEVNYTESGVMTLDLNRLANPSDGHLDYVQGLRNVYGADMVALILESGGYCGIANAIMATESTAFQVTRRSGCMTGYYSFSHEFGHLQGLRHDTYVDPTNTPFAYGHGHTHPSPTPSESWRTVMAYVDACYAAGYNCTRRPFFSNPTKTYLGAATGVIGVSENYRVLNETAFTVANFRQTKIDLPFTSLFNGSADGWLRVRGNWSVDSNFYSTKGVAGESASARHVGRYGDMTYTVAMHRAGCTTCANRLIIRGKHNNRTGSGWWSPGYAFQYNNAGEVSVYKTDTAGNLTALIDWTTSTAVKKEKWNTLTVVANFPNLKFRVNGYVVWQGRDTSIKVGTVGLGMFRDTSSTGNRLRVDYAILENTPTADPIPDAPSIAESDVGGLMRVSSSSNPDMSH